MKTIKYFAVLSLLVGLSGCNSKPDLDGFREVEISNNMLDTIPENRLNNYKETIEKTYLLGCLVLGTAGSSSESSPAQLKDWKESLNMPDTINRSIGRGCGTLSFIHKLRMKLNPDTWVSINGEKL